MGNGDDLEVFLYKEMVLHCLLLKRFEWPLGDFTKHSFAEHERGRHRSENT
jgi:hypothetical protein